MRFWRRHRSAGVRVAAKVHRDIVAGNRERDGRQWSAAAAAYRRALLSRPDLVHIHVQLGHVLRLDGRSDDAERAYREATRQRPEDRDANVALGHFLKQDERWADAAECFITAVLTGASDDEAMREARDAIMRIDADGRSRIAKLLDPGLATANDGSGQRGALPKLFFDISDLVSFFGHSRRPTGIQRVQVETIIHLLGSDGSGCDEVGICAFIDGRDEWVAVDEARMLDLARLSLADDDQDEQLWRRARDKLLLGFTVAQSTSFSNGSTLVNLGTSWWLSNYFLHLRAAMTAKNITYIPIVYDVVPAIMPELCLDNLVQDFNVWVLGIFSHADRFIAISQSTKKDLIAVGERLGVATNPARVAVVTLDARPNVADSVACTMPPAITGARFVLFVATIEPRKGHLTAFDAWQRLIDQHGADQVPQLVCVGRNGWRNAGVYSRLAASAALAARVTIVSDLSDDQLCALYDACLFTIYPSLYEGWGLPVTEALCRGKIVITTTASSLPEAGGDFALYVEPNDSRALADTAARLFLDDEARQVHEKRIAEEYAPRDWAGIAADICRQVAELRAFPPKDPPPIPTARCGIQHWIGRSMAVDLHQGDGTGEMFRAGLGWYAPKAWGCRVKREGGQLAFRVKDPARLPPSARLQVRLAGSNHRRCAFVVRSGSFWVEGVLGREERRSVALPLTIDANGVCITMIGGSTAIGQPEDLRSDRAGPIETVGVEGFAIIEGS